MNRVKVRVTDPHHEFFGLNCVLITSPDSSTWVRADYGDVLNIRKDQYEIEKSEVDGTQ